MKKKLVVLLSVVLVMCSLLCACGSNKSQFVGTWVCPKFVDYWSEETMFNQQIILKKDGTGTEQHAEGWALTPITWEVFDENTITIFTEQSGTTSRSNYTLNEDGKLIYDNGKVYREYTKQ